KPKKKPPLRPRLPRRCSSREQRPRRNPPLVMKRKRMPTKHQPRQPKARERRRRKTPERRAERCFDYSPAPSAGLASPAAGGFDLGSPARRSGVMISGGRPSAGLASPPAVGFLSVGFGAAFFCSFGFG